MDNLGPIVDEHGQLRGSGVHDSTIHEFKYSLHDRLDICLRGIDQRDRWLRLSGIAAIGFKDVVDGTVVSSIFCSKIDPTVQDHRTSTVNSWQILFGSLCAETDFWRVVAKTQEENAGSFLVLVESSYGGSIAAICKKITMKPRLPAHKRALSTVE